MKTMNICIQAGSPWLYIYPKGIEDLLLYTKKTYNNPTIYNTENGSTVLTTFYISLFCGSLRNPEQ